MSDSEKLYRKAREIMVNAIELKDFREAQRLFTELGDYRDSKKMAEICDKRAEALHEKIERESAEWNEKYADIKVGKSRTRTWVIIGILSVIVVLICLFLMGNDIPTEAVEGLYA